MKDAIASASKSAVPTDESRSKVERGPGQRAHSSPGGTPRTNRGSQRVPGSQPTGSGKKRRLTGASGSDGEGDHAEDKQENKKRAVATESRVARGGRVAAAAVAAVVAAGEGAGSGSPDILKPVDNDEREHLDPYIAKLQKRQRQQQRCD